MKLSDYVIDFLYKKGIRNCFLISGGAVLHLVNSANDHIGINIICSQHEQASITAADAVSRISETEIGFCLTTSGPGATNILTGLCNAYFDSIPLIAITGQVASFRQRRSNSLRQLGFQETDIVEIFKPVTKYVNCLESPDRIRFELEKAFYFAIEGRPGPVVLDIPDDFQRAEVDPKSLIGFEPELNDTVEADSLLEIKIEFLLAEIEKSKRPILVLGAGFHISKSASFAETLANQLRIPTLLTWGGNDLLPYHHELNLGGLGVCGSRLGNWAVQTSDLVISIGTRLSQMVTGSKLEAFAPSATKIMIDIDSAEFEKFKGTGLNIETFINSDIKRFINAITKRQSPKLSESALKWNKKLFSLKEKFSVIKENHDSDKEVNVYRFMDSLSTIIDNGDIIITDAGGNLSWTLQSFRNKPEQRLFSAWNHSPMGYSLPAAIGAALAANGTRVICIIGDGGIMMCLEEIATIVRNGLNIKIILINNLGHGIQKQTIETWLEGNYVAVNQETGLFFPNFELLCKSFDMEYLKISKNFEIESLLKNGILNSDKPQFVEVLIDQNERITPMLKFGAGLEELAPHVSAPNLLEL